MSNRRSKWIVLGVVAVLGLSGCAGGNAGGDGGGQGAGNTPAKGGTMHMLLSTEYSHLDPAQGFDGGVNNFYRLIYRTLTTQSAGTAKNPTEIVPDLATDLGTSNADGTEWTFTLKDGVKFETGKPITSADVKFGIERSLDPSIAIGSPYAKLLLKGADTYKGIYIDGPLDSIKTPDDKTIVFDLSQPFPEFPSALAQPVFTPFPADAGVTTTSLDEQPISSGPYKVTEYKRGSSLTLERNKDWDPKTDEVRSAFPDSWAWTFGLDAATIDERMIANRGKDQSAISSAIQAASVARVQTPDIKDRSVSGIQGCTTYLGLNTTKDVMKDVKVRQAINLATDRQAIADATGGNQLAEIATTMLPPTMEAFNEFDLYPSKDSAGDPAGAKKLLAEAGHPDGISFLLDIRNQPKMQAQAVALQQSLAKAGITVEFNLIDAAKYYETIGTTSQQHDAAITGWCPDWMSGLTFLPPLFEGSQIFPKGNSNIAQFNDPAVNERMNQIRAMSDFAAAQKAWGELDKQIAEQSPAVPLLFEKTVNVNGSNIAGAHAHGGFSGGIDLVSVGLKDPKK